MNAKVKCGLYAGLIACMVALASGFNAAYHGPDRPRAATTASTNVVASTNDAPSTNSVASTNATNLVASSNETASTSPAPGVTNPPAGHASDPGEDLRARQT